MYKKICVILLVSLVSFFAGCKGDDTSTTPPVTNHAPDAPNSPNPADGAVNVPRLVTLSWKCSDSDGDELKYDVYWGYDTNVSKVAGTGLTATSVSILETLTGNTMAYWKVVAKDSKGASTDGPIWHFTTRLQ